MQIIKVLAQFYNCLPLCTYFFGHQRVCPAPLITDTILNLILTQFTVFSINFLPSVETFASRYNTIY